jgi:hypothetical protein
MLTDGTWARRAAWTTGIIGAAVTVLLVVTVDVWMLFYGPLFTGFAVWAAWMVGDMAQDSREESAKSRAVRRQMRQYAAGDPVDIGGGKLLVHRPHKCKPPDSYGVRQAGIELATGDRWVCGDCGATHRWAEYQWVHVEDGVDDLPDLRQLRGA